MAENDLKSAFEDQSAPTPIEQFDVNQIPAEPVPPIEPVAPEVIPPTPEAPVEPVVPVEPKLDEQGNVIPEVIPPVEPPKEPTFFDKLKSDTPPAPEAPKVELPDDVKQKLEEYEKITNSEIFKLFNGEKDLTKIDLTELGKKLAGEDFSKYEISEILQRTLKLEYPNISDADLEKAVDSRAAQFSNLEEWEQNLNRQKMIDNLSQSSKPDDVFKTLESIKKNQSVNPVEDQRKAIDDYRQQLVTHYEGLTKQMIGQEYEGYKMTEDDAKATLAEFNDNVQNFKPETNFLRMMKAATYEKAVAAAEQRGYEKAMVEKGRPDFGKTVTPVLQVREQEGLKNMSLADFFEMQP